MIDFTTLFVGDHVRVRFNSGGRLDGCGVTGKITRIWNPAEGAHAWQGQVSGGWCFHPFDLLIEHSPPLEAAGSDQARAA